MSNEAELRKYLAGELSKDRLLENRVTLVIGEAAKLVKKMMTNSYYTVTNIEEARAFVAKFSVPSDQLVVVEDLSELTPAGQATFLKFIEDSYCPLLLLASRDILLDTIVSRSKVVIKVPVSTKYCKSSDSIADFIDTLESEDGSLQDKVALAEDSLLRCPDYFYIYRKYLGDKSLKAANKYIKLL